MAASPAVGKSDTQDYLFREANFFEKMIYLNLLIKICKILLSNFIQDDYKEVLAPIFF